MSTSQIPLAQPLIPADRSADTGQYPDPGAVVTVRNGIAQTAIYLLGALIADAAAIYPALAELFRASQPVVISGTVGFPLAAVGVAHTTGKLWRARRAADRHRANGTLLGVLTTGWVAFGGVICAVRVGFTPTTGGTAGGPSFPVPGTAAGAAGLSQPLASALVFAALYLVSGVLATATSYAHNPEARVHNVAYKAYLTAVDAQEKALARLARAQQAHQAALAEKTNSDGRHAAQRGKASHETEFLYSHARLRMSDSPRMTNAAFAHPPRRPAPGEP